MTPFTSGVPTSRLVMPDCSGPGAYCPLNVPATLMLGPSLLKALPEPVLDVLGDAEAGNAVVDEDAALSLQDLAIHCPTPVMPPKKSWLTFQAHGSVTGAEIVNTRIPASQARLIVGFSAVLDPGISMITSGFV